MLFFFGSWENFIVAQSDHREVCALSSMECLSCLLVGEFSLLNSKLLKQQNLKRWKEAARFSYWVLGMIMSFWTSTICTTWFLASWILPIGENIETICHKVTGWIPLEIVQCWEGSYVLVSSDTRSGSNCRQVHLGEWKSMLLSQCVISIYVSMGHLRNHKNGWGKWLCSL